MVLYDLAGRDDNLRFSPYCWRVKLALAHKGLDVDSRPWRFTEKERITFSGQEKVPILVDGEQVISDSWAIFNYLDAAYSHKPLLFTDDAAKEAAFNLKVWSEKRMLAPMFKILVLDIYNNLHANDQPWFREVREKRLGTSLEDFSDSSDVAISAFRELIEPLRTIVEQQSFISGERAAGADYLLYGPFQWAYCMSGKTLLHKNDPINRWCERMRSLFNNMAANAMRAS